MKYIMIKGFYIALYLWKYEVRAIVLHCSDTEEMSDQNGFFLCIGAISLHLKFPLI